MLPGLVLTCAVSIHIHISVDLGAGSNIAAVSIATAPDPGMFMSLNLCIGGRNIASIRGPITKAACDCALETLANAASSALEAGGHIASLAALEGQQHQGEGEEEGLHAGNGYSELTDTDTPILGTHSNFFYGITACVNTSYQRGIDSNRQDI